jgi:hypothetical protein
MASPSEYWSGLAGLDSASNRYKQVKLVLATANFEYLKDRALRSRRKQHTNVPVTLDCSINLAQFATGFDNLVLEIAFSDDVYWVARIPHQPLKDDQRAAMLSEIATVNLVAQQTSIPVPRVFEFEVTSDQPFGYPYMLMQALRGRCLDDGLAKAIPQAHHLKVAKQMANIFAELQRLSYSRIGRLWRGETADGPIEVIPMAWHHSPGPLETSLEYFYNERQGENLEIMTLNPENADWLTACWVLKSAIAHIVIDDRIRGPFPLCHLDLHYGNLLFDDEYNLTGVIDWSNAQVAPLEQLSVCPELIVFPGLSHEKNLPILELRKLVIQSLEELEGKQIHGHESPEIGLLPLKQSNQTRRPTRLSTYMASESAEIMHRQYMASPKGSLWAAKRIAKLIYKDHITWEQLKATYGHWPLH